MAQNWNGYPLLRERDGCWLAESRMIPGAASRGSTPEDAVNVLREAEAAFLRSARVSGRSGGTRQS